MSINMKKFQLDYKQRPYYSVEGRGITITADRTYVKADNCIGFRNEDERTWYDVKVTENHILINRGDTDGSSSPIFAIKTDEEGGSISCSNAMNTYDYTEKIKVLESCIIDGTNTIELKFYVDVKPYFIRLIYIELEPCKTENTNEKENENENNQ